MKKRFYILISFLSLMLFSCNKEIVFTLDFNEDDTTLCIVSDTHYLSQTLLKENTNYDEISFANDGRTVQYNTLVFDKMIDKALEENVDYFIITGDLTFNGEKVSHNELSDKLNKLIEHNIQPLVIPGNHDVNNFTAKDYSADKSKSTDYINNEDFKNIYKNAGYQNAYSYDKNSLSYIYQTKNNEWLVMLDSTYSRFNLNEGMIFIGGAVTSLDWLRENLNYAKENHIECTVFTHHNLINHNPLFSSLYDLNNKDELLELYKEYDIDFHFSGHLHIQDIKEKEGIYDISTSSLVDYGNRYGIFKMNKGGKEYISRNLDFLMEDKTYFSDYSKKLFYSKNYEKFYCNYDYLDNKNDAKTLADFQARVNLLYFNGDIYRNYSKLKREKGYSLAKKYLDDFENSYIYSMLESGNNESLYAIKK